MRRLLWAVPLWSSQLIITSTSCFIYYRNCSSFPSGKDKTKGVKLQLIFTARKEACVKNSVHRGKGVACSGGGSAASGGACSRGRQKVCCQEGCLLQGALLPGGWLHWGVWRPPVTATAAGGTHPTGMHSCFKENLCMILFFTLMSWDCVWTKTTINIKIIIIFTRHQSWQYM